MVLVTLSYLVYLCNKVLFGNLIYMSNLAYNVYSSHCPTRQALDRISDKWTVLVIDLLSNGPHRFSEIKVRIDGVSQKMLTQTLRKLERDGLVYRRINTNTVPISVTYSLTEPGKALIKPVGEMRKWAEEYIEFVLAAQQSYDANNPHE